MGHKVHPLSLRLGFVKTWSSTWFAKKKDFPIFLNEDVKIRKFIKEELSSAAIGAIDIERTSNSIRAILHSARPGVIIGKRGADIDRLREDLNHITNKEVFIDIKEIKNPSVCAQLITENIALQIEKRIGHKRAMKKAVQIAMDSGAGGIKIICSGRLAGAEMARRETIKQGKVPLHTLKADIDYGFCEALTTYGLIGIKVWVYHGELPPLKKGFRHGADAQEGQIQKEPARTP